MLTAELVLPPLYTKQAEIVNSTCKTSVTFASTKAGKTVAMINRMLGTCWAQGGPERDGYWFAPSYGVAKIAFRRMCKLLRQCDPKKTMWRANGSETYIELKHEGRMYFKGAERPDNLYGPDAIIVIIDEGSRCREEIYFVALSITTATRGRIYIIGNMKSRGNWMFKLWDRSWEKPAHKKDKNVDSFKIDAYDAVEGGVIDAEELETIRLSLPEHIFKALYLALPTELATNPFGSEEQIRALGGKGACTTAAAFGGDLAKSVDFNVGLGLDKYGQCCLFESWQAPWGITIPRMAELIGTTPALVDSTGVGDPIVEKLQSLVPNVTGMKFTQQSKQQMMEGLAAAVQQQEVGNLPDEVINEMLTFEFEYTRTGVKYGAPEGLHDDTVCALALAYMKLGKALKRNHGPLYTAVSHPIQPLRQF